METGPKVAIVDDDPNEAEIIGFEVQDAGFEPVLLEKDESFRQPSDLAEYIISTAQAAVCDHRLQDMAFAPFDGAAVVAELIVRKIPAVLVTQFFSMDADVSIRRWRHQVPVLLKRGDADSTAIKEGLAACMTEITGHPLPGRIPRRTLVRVAKINQESGEEVVDAVIPAWDPYQAVRFPASMLPESFRSSIDRDHRLFAKVNIGAQSYEELFFYDFEVAPEADEHDGLS